MSGLASHDNRERVRDREREGLSKVRFVALFRGEEFGRSRFAVSWFANSQESRIFYFFYDLLPLVASLKVKAIIVVYSIIPHMQICTIS